MTAAGWRRTALVLGGACVVLLWRDCHRPAARPPHADPIAERSASTPAAISDDDHHPSLETPQPPSTANGADGSFYGFRLHVPAWAMALTPQPGEDLRAYRDRMVPLAQQAIAPHRARVARSRDDFAARAHLDTSQRALLDRTALETASALEERVLAAVLNGEVAPSTFKPMAGVGIARELLEIVDRGNRTFVGALREDQQRELAAHPFDFADYLVFSTRWEDALGAL